MTPENEATGEHYPFMLSKFQFVFQFSEIFWVYIYLEINFENSIFRFTQIILQSVVSNISEFQNSLCNLNSRNEQYASVASFSGVKL